MGQIKGWGGFRVGANSILPHLSISYLFMPSQLYIYYLLCLHIFVKTSSPILPWLYLSAFSFFCRLPASLFLICLPFPAAR